MIVTADMVHRAHAEMQRRDLMHPTDDGYDVGSGASEDDARAVLDAALPADGSPDEETVARVIAALRPIVFSWWTMSGEGQHLGPDAISDDELCDYARKLLDAARSGAQRD
jgi:hypothetical protein